MSRLREQVLAFHRAYGQPIGERPRMLTTERLRLRLGFLAEELCELLDGCGAYYADIAKAENALADAIASVDSESARMVEVVDALHDLDYFSEGMRIELGVDGEPIGEEIHASNLSKLGADGRPVLRADGKVMKGPNYREPDLEPLLVAQGWEP